MTLPILLSILCLLLLTLIAVMALPRTRKAWKSFFIYYLVLMALAIFLSFLFKPHGATALIIFWLPTFILGFTFAALMTATFHPDQRGPAKGEKFDVRASKIGLGLWFIIFLISLFVLKAGVYNSLLQ